MYFTPASDEHQKRERLRARVLRTSLWWRQQVGIGICSHCKQKFSASKLTMDHVIPIVRGGKSNKKNCVPSCKACNTEKGYLTSGELAFEKMRSQNQNHESESDHEE